jgi:sugar phosphate isomerase/epimerase
MRNLIDRRDFLRTTGALGAGIGLTSLGGSELLAAPAAKGAPHAEKLGWRLGCQAYSFNRFTFYDAIGKTASLGLRYIEMYPGQTLSKEKADVHTDESMSAQVRKELKKKLADSGVKLVCYGVCGLSKDEGNSRRTFDFAKDMGIETIVSEPAFDAFDTVDKLCGEYSINVALHDHPRPSRYWNPDIVLKVCKGRSKRIGACADTGHWMRSGLNPLECIKKLEGRIISFHFKDLNRYGEGAHDVPWGTGEGDVKGMLTEIHRQGFKGVFSIEYEYNWLDSLPEIAQSVAYFDRVAAGLAGKR